MSAHWPIQDVDKDKFPYLHLRSYLKYRGHDNLLRFVPWESGAQSERYQSSTHIQVMKLQVMQNIPEIAALLESKEAHIRLLSGTWGAIKGTRVLVYTGIVLSVAGFGASHIWKVQMGVHPLIYTACLLLSGTLALIMEWSRRTIERLFHYQRVRELFLIIASAYEAEQVSNAPRKTAKPDDHS